MNSFNEENKILNQSTIIQLNNDFLRNKAIRGYITSNTFRKKSKNQKNNLNIITNIRTNKKKLPIKSLSSSYINQSNLNNDTFFIKRINKSSIEENVNNFIFNINESISNKGNPENVLIQLNSNKSINSEKIKVQKKLDEFRKLIDKKLYELKSNRSKKKHRLNINKSKTSTIRLKLFDKEGKFISGNNNSETISDKIKRKIICISNRNHNRNIRKKIQIA